MRSQLRAFALAVLMTTAAFAQPTEPWLADRGPGVPISMFGTYIRPGELLAYPFFEYYKDKDFEYKPAELGFGVDEDFRGKYRAREVLLQVAYGFTDRLAVEFEAAHIKARLEKSPDDPSSLPPVIEESGIGDIEAGLRYCWLKETAATPEIFSYYEIVFPHHKEKLLIGTADAEHQLGAGAIKGFHWGTMTLRGSIESAGDGVEAGEFGIEYLKRVSDRVRLFTAIEGVQDEIEWIAEMQLRVRPGVTLKLNNAVGITSKATDWAPEIGVIFSFGGDRR